MLYLPRYCGAKTWIQYSTDFAERLKNEKTSIFNIVIIKLRFVDNHCSISFVGTRRIGFLAACYLLSNNCLDVSLVDKTEEHF
jgi:hypothetical protein